MSEQRIQWWRAGDLDGFFGLFVDNLIQIILIVTLCSGLLGMPDDLVYAHILPGVAVSLLVGNLFYAWQARRLIQSGQAEATALPYGINTVSLFAYVLFVMLPVVSATGDAHLAWQLGLAACLGSGLIELIGAFIAGWIKQITPRAALLATLAGIAITFISMDFTFRIFADPIIAFAPLGIIFLQYIGKLKLPGGLPAGFVAVVAGTSLAWALGRMDADALTSAMHLQIHPPMPAIAELFGALVAPELLGALAIIVPMGLFNLIGSLQNLESAEAAGDSYPVKSSLVANGSNIGSVGLEALSQQLPIAGMIALSQGFIFTSMVLAAMTVALIESRLRLAAAWAGVAAALSASGIIHGYEITASGIINAYGLASTWPFVIGYLTIAAIFMASYYWSNQGEKIVVSSESRPGESEPRMNTN